MIIFYECEEDTECWCLEINEKVVCCDYPESECPTVSIYDRKHLFAMLEAALGRQVSYDVIGVTSNILGIDSNTFPTDVQTWECSLAYRRSRLNKIRHAVRSVLTSMSSMDTYSIDQATEDVINCLVAVP